MPIPFSSIPDCIQLAICEKLRFDDFVKFYGSSRNAFEIAMEVTTKYRVYLTEAYIDCGDGIDIERRGKLVKKFPEFIDDFPIHFVVEDVTIYNSILAACENAKNYPITIHRVTIEERIDMLDCTPDDFNNLLEYATVKEIKSFSDIPLEYIAVPAFKQITSLNMKICSLRDENFLSLKIPTMILSGTRITDLGLNTYIKEWVRGERNIGEFRLDPKRPIQINIIFHGIDLKENQEIDRHDGSLILRNYPGSCIHLSEDKPTSH